MGADIDYNGNPTGYTLDPQENIVYASAHDNETLWDAIQYKAPEDATVADRVRMNSLAVDFLMLSQGIPFFHAGDDLLRSKSMDGNSYNSGDWFNRLDLTYQTNNWGVGLPPTRQENWPIIQTLLGNPALAVTPDDIMASEMHFREMLQIRRSSPLFRLQTAEDVMNRLTFQNVGPDQVGGVIVMTLSDTVGEDLDPAYSTVVVVFNTQPDAVTIGDAMFTDMAFELHPVQVSSFDSVVQGSSFDAASGMFTVPGRTTAVFVVRQ
jgi:pullulanase